MIKIIDEFSIGVTLIPEDARVRTEVEELVRGPTTREQSSPKPVWTRLAYVLGNVHQVGLAVPPEVELTFQKALFDRLWEQPLSLIATQIDPATYSSRPEMSLLANRLNCENQAHRTVMNSFEGVLADELSGTAELADAPLREMIVQIYETETGGLAPPADATDRTQLNFLRACLGGAHGRCLPTLHIQANLHALFRWEYRDKLLTPNDMFDFAHAAAALAYCDAFFTDEGVAKSITHRRLRLDEHYGCFVTNSTQDAVGYLRSIAE